VLTGDEELGYWSSADPPTAWMSAILDVIRDRQLRYICMPGSHDAGMSVINGYTALVEESNVLTQRFSKPSPRMLLTTILTMVAIGQQLLKGSRYFNMRPVQGNSGAYLLRHYSESSVGWLGANGQYLADVVDEVNK
jgi:hypothetical protein